MRIENEEKIFEEVADVDLRYFNSLLLCLNSRDPKQQLFLSAFAFEQVDLDLLKLNYFQSFIGIVTQDNETSIEV